MSLCPRYEILERSSSPRFTEIVCQPLFSVSIFSVISTVGIDSESSPSKSSDASTPNWRKNRVSPENPMLFTEISIFELDARLWLVVERFTDLAAQNVFPAEFPEKSQESGTA